MLKDDCLFCKIIRGEIPSAKVYEDEDMLVFRDIEPKAKVHLLAVPKDHFKLLSEMDGDRAELVKRMLEKIPAIAAENGCEKGYRLWSTKAKTRGSRCSTCTYTSSAGRRCRGSKIFANFCACVILYARAGCRILHGSLLP